jgi:hypothetical protein
MPRLRRHRRAHARPQRRHGAPLAPDEAAVSRVIAGRSARYGLLSPGQIFDANAFIGALSHVLFRHEFNEGHC